MASIYKLEKVLKAVANRRRLAILKYLKKVDQATVSDISRKINLSFRATSRHLQILLAADLVIKYQRHLYNFYALSSNQLPFIKKLLDSL